MEITVIVKVKLIHGKMKVKMNKKKIKKVSNSKDKKEQRNLVT
jgi:hypothetical protein